MKKYFFTLCWKRRSSSVSRVIWISGVWLGLENKNLLIYNMFLNSLFKSEHCILGYLLIASSNGNKLFLISLSPNQPTNQPTKNHPIIIISGNPRSIRPVPLELFFPCLMFNLRLQWIIIHISALMITYAKQDYTYSWIPEIAEQNTKK